MRSLLSVGEHERLPRVEAPPHSAESARLAGDAKEGRKTEKKSRSAAGLENELVRPDEHGGLAVGDCVGLAEPDRTRQSRDEVD